MTTEETDLTFIRCPNCRSLIPAIATRCRMCGTQFERKDKEGGGEDAAGADMNDSARRSRVRQRTITATPEEVEEVKRNAAPDAPAAAPTPPQAAPPPPAAASTPGAAPFRFGRSPEPPPAEETPDEDHTDALPERAPEERRRSSAPPFPGITPAREDEEDEEEWGEDEDDALADEGGEDDDASAPSEELGSTRPEGKRKRRRRRKKKGGQPAVPPPESFDRPNGERLRAESPERPLGSDRSPGGDRSAGLTGRPPAPQAEPELSGGFGSEPVAEARRGGGPAQEMPRAEPPRVEPPRVETPRVEPPARQERSRGDGGRAEASGDMRGGRADSRTVMNDTGNATENVARSEQVQGMREQTPVRDSRPAEGRHGDNRSGEARSNEARGGQTVPEILPTQAEGTLVGWLVDFAGDGRGEPIELRAGKFFVGRQKLRGNDLVLDNPTISTPHCIMTASGPDGLHVQDLMSERGTTYRRASDHRMQPVQGVVTLHHGDYVRLGEYELMVCIVPPRSKA